VSLRGLDAWITGGRGHETEIDVACPNEACPEYGVTVPLLAWCEYGAAEPAREDDWFCPECGTERVDPADLQEVRA
jgi:hypothetical protein